MGTLIKRDIFDFYGNKIIVQQERDELNNYSYSMNFYGKKILIEPTWHPWFGPAFVSRDRHALAGLTRLIIPTPIALEYGDKAVMLYKKEGYKRMITETEMFLIDPQNVNIMYDLEIDDSDEEIFYPTEDQMEDIRKIEEIGMSLLTKAEAQNCLIFESIAEPSIKGISLDRYIPINNIFFKYTKIEKGYIKAQAIYKPNNIKLPNTVNNVKLIYIPKDIVPNDMEVSAQNVYNLIAQQHWYNYNKYVAKVFQEIAQSDPTNNTVKLPWINTWSTSEDDVPERTITVQIIEKNRYGIVTGKEI